MFLFSVDKTLKFDIEKYNLYKYHIMYHDNIGMDIGPYLLQISYILENLQHNSYDYIYKIHTKTNLGWFNELCDIDINGTDNIYMAEKWKLKLDNLNISHINEICMDYNIENIYYDEILKNDILYDEIDEAFYASYYDQVLNDCSIISHLLSYNVNKKYIYDHAIENKYIVNEKYISLKRKRKIYFCAGSIFIIKFKLVYDFFNKIDIKSLYNKLERGYSINDNSTYVHALERIISSFFL
jgi:hypothetical protein